MNSSQSIAAGPRIDVKRYGKLIVQFAPKAIETEAENNRALAIIEKLMLKGESLTPEEEVALNLLVTLVERYEQNHDPLPDADPVEVLRELMSARDLKPIDLTPALGSRAKASEIFSGKRSISKTQAKALGKLFNVSPAAFI
jgi:HTH-type transcriptional regulator/antitoxin HigA